MAVLASQMEPRTRYRPTRVGEWFDYLGRSWWTRPTDNAARKAIARLRQRFPAISGREASVLQMVCDSGWVLVRRHRKIPGVKTVRVEWAAIPPDYKVRSVVK